jgi:hypothetical protein
MAFRRERVNGPTCCVEHALENLRLAVFMPEPTLITSIMMLRSKYLPGQNRPEGAAVVMSQQVMLGNEDTQYSS